MNAEHLLQAGSLKYRIRNRSMFFYEKKKKKGKKIVVSWTVQNYKFEA